jgi:hypothetical protein
LFEGPNGTAKGSEGCRQIFSFSSRKSMLFFFFVSYPFTQNRVDSIVLFVLPFLFYYVQGDDGPDDQGPSRPVEDLEVGHRDEGVGVLYFLLRFVSPHRSFIRISYVLSLSLSLCAVKRIRCCRRITGPCGTSIRRLFWRTGRVRSSPTLLSHNFGNSK